MLDYVCFLLTVASLALSAFPPIFAPFIGDALLGSAAAAAASFSSATHWARGGGTRGGEGEMATESPHRARRSVAPDDVDASIQKERKGGRERRTAGNGTRVFQGCFGAVSVGRREFGERIGKLVDRTDMSFLQVSVLANGKCIAVS